MVDNVVEHFTGLQGEVVGIRENVVQSRREVAPVGVGSFDDVHSDSVWWHGTAGQSSMMLLLFFFFLSCFLPSALLGSYIRGGG